MDLENMRQNGVRSLWVQCKKCRHTTVMNVDHLPGDLAVASFGPRMVCTKCGTIGQTRDRTGRSGGRSERKKAARKPGQCHGVAPQRPRGTTCLQASDARRLLRGQRGLPP